MNYDEGHTYCVYSDFLFFNTGILRIMAGTEKQPTEDHPMRIKERRFKGILMWQCEAEEFETMETREDDIWVCTYPRSGMLLFYYLHIYLTCLKTVHNYF